MREGADAPRGAFPACIKDEIREMSELYVVASFEMVGSRRFEAVRMWLESFLSNNAAVSIVKTNNT